MNPSTSSIETTEARAQRLTVTGDALFADLLDGRTITVPLAWYPRLAHGSDTERAHWRFIGEGEGIHISIAGSTRQLNGNAIRKCVKLLGLSEARSGIRLDEFQAGASLEQELVRKFRRVLDRLADA